MNKDTYNERQYRIWIHTSADRHSKCSKCGAEIIWMKTERGKMIPANPRKKMMTQQPDDNVKLLDPLGRIQRTRLYKSFGWEIHFDTCTGAPVKKESAGEAQ
jgi:hypothetical protein